MDLVLEPFENISEVWITGPHSVEVHARNHLYLKIF